jgi:predicted amidohydrolase YtcJ
MITYDLMGDLSRVTSIAGLQSELRRIAVEIPAPGWVIGLRFEDQNLREHTLPSRHDLDAACPDRPALVVKADGHMVIANTAAIRACGATAATPDPAGGRIDREPDGHPAGPFRETASELPLGAAPLPDIRQIRDSARRCFQTLAANGVTSAGVILQTDAEGVFGKTGAFDVLMMNALLDLIPINLYVSLVARDLGPVEAARQTGLRREGDPSRRTRGLKFWCDGTFGSRTAFMARAYEDRPGERGFLVLEADEMYRRMVMGHRAGLQILVHVVGDAAARTVVDLYDRLLAEHPRPDHRHRIEHASILDAGLVRDIARLGLVVSATPLFIENEQEWLPGRLGPERTAWTYPLRALVEAGVKVAGASDAPICSTSVLTSVSCACIRDGFVPEQSLGVNDALRMFTRDAAFAQFEENEKGTISPGKRADLVILSRNPLRTPAAEVREIVVDRTICGGRVIHPI